MERDFEKKCQSLINKEDWSSLYDLSFEYLDASSGKSFKGFFYQGISLYKQCEFDGAIRAFSKAEQINNNDA